MTDIEITQLERLLGAAKDLESLAASVEAGMNRGAIVARLKKAAFNVENATSGLVTARREAPYRDGGA